MIEGLVSWGLVATAALATGACLFLSWRNRRLHRRLDSLTHLQTRQQDLGERLLEAADRAGTPAALVDPLDGEVLATNAALSGRMERAVADLATLLDSAEAADRSLARLASEPGPLALEVPESDASVTLMELEGVDPPTALMLWGDAREPSERPSFSRELLEALPHRVFELDRRGRITYANRPLDGQQDLRGTSILDHLADQERRTMAQALERVVQHREGRVLHLESEGADGIHHRRTHLTPILDDGQVTGVAVAINDADQEYRVRQTLRRAEEFLDATLDALQSAIAILDSDGNVVAANKAWRSGFDGSVLAPGRHGVGENYLRALEELEARGESPHTGLAQGLREVTAGDRRKLTLERRTKRDGQERCIEVRVTPFRENPHLGVIVRYEDITDRKRAEQERQRAGEQFQVAAGELSRTVGAATDPDEVAQRLVEATHRACPLPAVGAVGDEGLVALWSSSEEHGLRLQELLEARPDELTWVPASLPDAQRSLNLVLLSKNQSVPEGDLRKVKILATQASLAYHRAEVLESIREAYERLDTSLMQKQVFLDVLSHDLKNPLAVARGRLELLQLRNEDLEDELGTIEGSLDRAERLIQNALFYSRLEEQDEVERVERDVMQLVWEVCEGLTPLAEDEGVRIQVSGPDLLVCPTHPMLGRTVENLLSNAIKWSPEGEAVQVHLEQADETVRLSVIDHGPGIPEEKRRKLFSRFSRVDQSGVKGTGLGLAIAKRIVDMHQGTIRCEETPGGGATFVLEVPLDLPETPADDAALVEKGKA